MSIQIKSLTVGAPTIDNALAAQNDNFNVIPSANTVYDLYIAPNDVPNKNVKTTIVKAIRLVNTGATSVTINLYFNRPNASGLYRRRLISPVNMSLPAGFLFIDNDEITLEPGDHLQGMASVGGVVQYNISGVERDA